MIYTDEILNNYLKTPFYGSVYLNLCTYDNIYNKGIYGDYYHDYYHEHHTWHEYYYDWINCPIRKRQQILNDLIGVTNGKSILDIAILK